MITCPAGTPTGIPYIVCCTHLHTLNKIKKVIKLKRQQIKEPKGGHSLICGGN